MHWLSQFFCMEAKFGPFKKGQKILLTSVEMKLFRGTATYTLYLPQKEMINFGRVKIRTN